MTKNQNELIDKWKEHDELNQYQGALLKDKFKRFIEITNYDFNKDVVKKNVGNEARTFHKINQSKPLLSPSRILKLFNEHKYWIIPQKHLIRPRLMGQLIHKIIEMRIKNQTIIKITNENIADMVGEDYALINQEWNESQIELFINETNDAVNEIYNFLNLKQIVVLECEKYVANKEYHGYIDLVGYIAQKSKNSVINKTPIIIDLKVTSNETITNDYLLQLAIYRQIYEKCAQCYILFYDRNNKTCRLEKASWSELDNIFEKIDSLIKMFRS